jgi:hypothetical protein
MCDIRLKKYSAIIRLFCAVKMPYFEEKERRKDAAALVFVVFFLKVKTAAE